MGRAVVLHFPTGIGVPMIYLAKSYTVSETDPFAPRRLDCVMPSYPLMNPSVGDIVGIQISDELEPKFVGRIWDLTIDDSGENGYSFTAYDNMKYLERETFKNYSGTYQTILTQMATELQLAVMPGITIPNPLPNKVYQGTYLSILKEISDETFRRTGIYYRPMCNNLGLLGLHQVGMPAPSLTIITQNLLTKYTLAWSLEGVSNRYRLTDTTMAEGSDGSTATAHIGNDVLSQAQYGVLAMAGEINNKHDPTQVTNALKQRYSQPQRVISMTFGGTVRYAYRVGDLVPVVANHVGADFFIVKNYEITNTGDDDSQTCTLTKELW